MRDAVNSALGAEILENISVTGNFELLYRSARSMKLKIKNMPPYIFNTLQLNEKLFYRHSRKPFINRYGPNKYNNIWVKWSMLPQQLNSKIKSEK